MKKVMIIATATISVSFCHAQSKTSNLKKSSNQKNIKMSNQNFTSTINVDKGAIEAFDAIKNFRGWWSEDIEGETDKLGEIFFYHYKDVHLCKLKLIEELPGKKLVYEVVDNQFSFTKDKTEWIGTKLIFDIAGEEKHSRITFTHEGLMLNYECYNVCNDAWTGFIQKSLKDFINNGKGQPNPKDGTNEINAENIKKWKINGNEQNENYSFGFETNRSTEDVFNTLVNPHNWWTGIYGETIEGNFSKVGDEFTYKAGDGLHYTEQKVMELAPGKKIVWLITKSKLSFLQQKDEWTGTSIEIIITRARDKTHVQFIHKGLIPAIECYGACSNAWSLYMNNLKQHLNDNSN